jgi:hypothetical protein
MSDDELATLAWLERRPSGWETETWNDRRGVKPETVDGCAGGGMLCRENPKSGSGME